ncbi:hypothetical protein D9M72_646140 [compost metagenome]
MKRYLSSEDYIKEKFCLYEEQAVASDWPHCSWLSAPAPGLSLWRLESIGSSNCEDLEHLGKSTIEKRISSPV